MKLLNFTGNFVFLEGQGYPPAFAFDVDPEPTYKFKDSLLEVAIPVVFSMVDGIPCVKKQGTPYLRLLDAKYFPNMENRVYPFPEFEEGQIILVSPEVAAYLCRSDVYAMCEGSLLTYVK